MKKEIDTGDILCQESIEVGPDENVGSVHDRLMEIGARLTTDTVDCLLAGTLSPIPQDELLKGIEPTPAPKIFKEDCEIDWTRTSPEIHNHVRGLSPYPAAWTTLKLGKDNIVTTVKILATGRNSAHAILGAGELLLEGKKAFAGCGHGDSIELIEVQPAGKRPMNAADYLRGLRLGECGAPHFE